MNFEYSHTQYFSGSQDSIKSEVAVHDSYTHTYKVRTVRNAAHKFMAYLVVFTNLRLVSVQFYDLSKRNVKSKNSTFENMTSFSLLHSKRYQKSAKLLVSTAWQIEANHS